METNTASLSEIITLNLFLGSITYLMGIAFQILIVFLNKSKSRVYSKVAALLVLSRISTIVFSLLIWHFWFLKIDVMFGPLLLPALIAELVFSPLFLKLFGYKVFKKINDAVD
jgi:hypothetical protein